MKTNKQIEKDFLAAEINERNKLVSFTNNFKRGIIFYDRIAAPGDFCGFDAAIISGNTKMLVEVKCRNFRTFDYKDAILEKKKLDAMFVTAREIEQKKEYNEMEIGEYYFCFYLDAIAIWDTNKHITGSRSIHCPKTTCGDTTKEWKDCFTFDFKDAEIIYFKKE